MARDLAIAAADRPGVDASIAETLGKAGINIEGTFGFGVLGEIHVLVEDAAAARKALEEAAFEVVEERDVLVLKVDDRPGAWGQIARRIADAGLNIDFHYLATNTRIVVAVDDLEKARTALR